MLSQRREDAKGRQGWKSKAVVARRRRGAEERLRKGKVNSDCSRQGAKTERERLKKYKSKAVVARRRRGAEERR